METEKSAQIFSQKLQAEICASRRYSYGKVYSGWYLVDIMCYRYNHGCSGAHYRLYRVRWCSYIRWKRDKHCLLGRCRHYHMKAPRRQKIRPSIFLNPPPYAMYYCVPQPECLSFDWVLFVFSYILHWLYSIRKFLWSIRVVRFHNFVQSKYIICITLRSVFELKVATQAWQCGWLHHLFPAFSHFAAYILYSLFGVFSFPKVNLQGIEKYGSGRLRSHRLTGLGFRKRRRW